MTSEKKANLILALVVTLAIAVGFFIYGVWALLITPVIIVLGVGICLLIDKWIEG